MAHMVIVSRPVKPEKELGEMTEEMQANNKKRWITEGLVIAVFPLFGYMLAFAYEWGYFSHFNVPIELIQVGLAQVLIATAAVLAIFSVLFIYFLLAQMLFPHINIHDPVARCFIRTFPFLLMFAALLITYGSAWKNCLWFCKVLCVILFFEFIFPLFTQYHIKGYRAKLVAQEDIERKTTTIIDTGVTKYGKRPFIFLVLILLTILEVFFLGHSSALKKKTFLVDSSQSEYVIVRIYGDTVISAKYEEESRELSGDIIIQKVSQMPLVLVPKEVGPLKRWDANPKKK